MNKPDLLDVIHNTSSLKLFGILLVGGVSLAIGRIISSSISPSWTEMRLEEQRARIEKLENEVNLYKLHEENVLGEPTPEKFYWVNNQRVYLEIDGKPVETYFNK